MMSGIASGSQVFMTIPGYGLPIVARDRKITILGSGSGKWTITPSISMNSSALLSNPLADPNLVIRPNVLEPHKVYTIRLTLTETSWAEIELTVEGEPFGGIISFKPATGIALQDLFHVDYQGWKCNPD